MKVTLAQINPVVGDVDGNLERILDHLPVADHAGADLIVFPELCLSGYPPLDLLERNAFVAQCGAALDAIEEASRHFPNLGIVVGLPLPTTHNSGKPIANAAVLVHNGETLHRQDKTLLPTYDVFDEARYFSAAETIAVYSFKGETLGLSVCEDAWNDPALFPNAPYEMDPISELAAKGASLLVNISASPFALEKDTFRAELLASHAKRHGLPFVFVNQVGGNDELVFDGCSLVVAGDGSVTAALPMFTEAVETVDLSQPSPGFAYEVLSEEESIYRALVLGTRDYLHKCGFTRALVGLSGGIDSALTATIAVDAIGADKVHGLAMPSPYSSAASKEDARALAANLGIGFDTIEIGDVMDAYSRALAPAFSGLASGVAEENIQARIRGNLLMAHSNKFGHLLLTTGNKSEMAVGYCTLYGDMSGGLAVISDVPKTMVYNIARFINRDGERIPLRTITKQPSAELKPDQLDSDTLPPYDVLDDILDRYVELAQTPQQICESGHDAAIVEWVVSAVRRSEYKRKQAPPGIKVTSKAFGMGRRMPIAARFTV